APTGAGATNEIVATWVDGPTPTSASPGPPEKLEVAYSTDRGRSFTKVTDVAASGDRPDYPAIAITPDGHDVVLSYNPFLPPWQTTTANPRLVQGVVRHANVGSGAAPSGWTTVHRGSVGDARAS